MSILKLLFFKIFIYILLGWVLGQVKGLNARKPIQYFINLAIYLLFPLFVLFSVWANHFPRVLLAQISLLALGVLAAGALLALLFARIFKVDFRDHSLPIIFANSAYLGIPVSTYIIGPAATVYAIIFDLTPTLFMFTLGIILVARENKFREAARVPLVYAVLAGLALNLAQVPVNAFTNTLVGYLKNITIPLILIFIGYQFRPARPDIFGRVLVASLFRMAGGLLAAWLLVRWLNLQGVAAGVCLLSASMPCAVNSYVLAQKYRADTEFPAAAIAVSTLLSIPFIAFVSLLIR
jgi:malate permease and related proteins